MFVFAGHDGTTEPLAQGFELRLEHAAIAELQKTCTFGGRPEDDRSERGFNEFRPHAVSLPGIAGGFAVGAPKRIPEPAVRVESVTENDVVQGMSLPNPLQCRAESPAPAVGLKGHVVMALEIPPGPRRVDAHAPNLGVANTGFGILVHELQELSHPLGGPPIGVERAAALAGTESGEERLFGGAVEGAVLR